jgi:N-acetylglutamate synthase-like GNAT family acetyltransferase
MTVIRRATLEDVPYIESLRRKEGQAVGFLPIERYYMEIDGRRKGTILVAEENGDLVGFIYGTHNKVNHVCHLQQLAIQEDARRVERGVLLTQAAQREGEWLVTARVAADLDAVNFWNAIGFEVFDEVAPKSVYGKGKEKRAYSNRRILRFQKVVGGLWAPRPEDHRDGGHESLVSELS